MFPNIEGARSPFHRHLQGYREPVQDLSSFGCFGRRSVPPPLRDRGPGFGSIANLYGLLLARHRAHPEGRSRGMAEGPRLVAFISDQVPGTENVSSFIICFIICIFIYYFL